MPGGGLLQQHPDGAIASLYRQNLSPVTAVEPWQGGGGFRGWGSMYPPSGPPTSILQGMKPGGAMPPGGGMRPPMSGGGPSYGPDGTYQPPMNPRLMALYQQLGFMQPPTAPMAPSPGRPQGPGPRPQSPPPATSFNEQKPTGVKPGPTPGPWGGSGYPMPQSPGARPQYPPRRSY